MQNEQTLANKHKITHLSVVLADKTDGPFRLDIKSIKAVLMKKELSDMDVVPPK